MDSEGRDGEIGVSGCFARTGEATGVEGPRKEARRPLMMLTGVITLFADPNYCKYPKKFSPLAFNQSNGAQT